MLCGCLEARAYPVLPCFARHLTAELGQTVHRCTPHCEDVVVADEPGERVVDLPEGVGDLHQDTKRNCPGEVTRSSDQQREEIGKLTDEELEGQELAVTQDEAFDIVVDRLEAVERDAAFLRFAAIERDALGLLAQTHQTEAEVCLDALRPIIEADE